MVWVHRSFFALYPRGSNGELDDGIWSSLDPGSSQHCGQASGYGDLQTPGQLQRQLFGPIGGDRFVHGRKRGRRSSALAVLVLCRIRLRDSSSSLPTR